MTILASYVAANQFTVATDRQAEFHVGRRVQADCGPDGLRYGTIATVGYVDPNTVVTLTAGSDALTVNLASVKYGLVGHGPTQSVPEHSHAAGEGEGGAIDHSALTDNEPAKHRTINDTGTLATDLFSAAEIIARLATKLNGASYTAADVLAKLLTVDGPGTGLNADLLDGEEATYFAPASDLTTHTGTADIHRKITISTLDPSGGVDGDVWFKYDA